MDIPRPLVLRPELRQLSDAQDPSPKQGQAPDFVPRDAGAAGAGEAQGTQQDAGGAQRGAGQQQDCMSMLPWMIGMVAIFYFLLIRPQQKQEKKRKAMLSAIKEGDKVVTSGGIHGTISSMNDETVVLRVDPKVKLTVDRQHVGRVVGGDDAKDKAG